LGLGGGFKSHPRLMRDFTMSGLPTTSVNFE